MARPTSFKSSHSPEELDALAKKEPVARVRDRIRLIALLARNHPVCEACEAMGMSLTTGWLWSRRYMAEGLDGLKDRPRPGKPRKITPQNREKLDQRIGQGSACGRSRITGKEVREWVIQQFGVEITLSTAYKELHRTKYSLQRPAAKHEKNDPVKMEEFKKESPLLPRN